MKYNILLFFSAVCLFYTCKSSSGFSNVEGPQKSPSFASYWYQSKAEVSSYQLNQSRYGEIHEGQASLIFVTEPFSTTKQVKADNGMANDAISVLKCNQGRKFNTGIYPYSTMTSSFTPVDYSAPSASLKITNSVQEWCGQVFMQMNKRGGQYDIQSYSYFESEGDVQSSIPSGLLEDEIMSLIRINPAGLPIGNIQVFPSTVYLRFMHKEVKSYKALAKNEKTHFNNQDVQAYTIEYPNLGRTYTVYYREVFPHVIEGWEETYKSFKGNVLTTKASLQEQILSDYWNRNAVADSSLYQQLFDF